MDEAAAPGQGDVDVEDEPPLGVHAFGRTAVQGEYARERQRAEAPTLDVVAEVSG